MQYVKQNIYEIIRMYLVSDALADAVITNRKVFRFNEKLIL